MTKKEYKEYVINFNDDGCDSFTNCGISIRDYGDTMVLVDCNARNGVLSFKTAKNKPLVEKIRNEDYEMKTSELLINPGAVFKTSLGERRYIIEKCIVIPAKYDYNYGILYDNGYMGPISEIPENHALDSTKFYTYENKWENYCSEYGKYDDPYTAMVYCNGKQYLLTGESGHEWHDGMPRCCVNNIHLVYGPIGWEAYGTNHKPDFPEPVRKMLMLFATYLRDR